MIRHLMFVFGAWCLFFVAPVAVLDVTGLLPADRVGIVGGFLWGAAAAVLGMYLDAKQTRA